MDVLNSNIKAFKRGINMHPRTHLMVKALQSRVFKVLVRFMMVLGLTLILIPLSIIKLLVNEESGKPVSVIKPEVVVSDPMNMEFIPLLFNDLNNEGILKTGNKGLFLLRDEKGTIKGDVEFSCINNLVKQSSIPNQSFDKSNVFAMKKLEKAPTKTSSTNTKRRLLGYNRSEAKRAALKKLEDVLLEPPRASSTISKSYLKRTKYLPDLLGDSLESYPRRVFIDVGLPNKEGGSGTSWFNKNYPTRNLKFEMYKIKTLTKGSYNKEWVAPPNIEEIGMSDWLWKNVKEEEYVVMKAEAGVVEDIVKSKAVRLVDELFLECKPRGLGGIKNMSKRAYWE